MIIIVIITIPIIISITPKLIIVIIITPNVITEKSK